jgi:hypothetical protein
MKKLFLVFVMLLSGSAWAEWVELNETEDTTFFYDPDTIRKDGNMRRVWRLQNLKQLNENGVMSRRIRVEYDCKQERFRILDLTSHSEPMARGTIVFNDVSGEWTGIPPRTGAAIMLNLVCSN